MQVSPNSCILCPILALACRSSLRFLISVVIENLALRYVPVATVAAAAAASGSIAAMV